MLVSRVFGLPLSFRSPARQTRSRAASVSTTISAISSVTSWWPAIGLPNVLRVVGYVTDASMHACATPTAPAATEYRPESSALMATLKPSPISPRRFVSGTRTSSRMSSLESEERRPSFPCSAWLPYGCRSRSRTNAVMPLCSLDGSPCANTSARPDTEPFEIHVLRPRRTHESPSRLALVRIFVASLPTSGSVRPKHPRTSPLQRRGSQRCFCSSVPNLRTVISTSEIWTESVVRTDESARPTSSVTSACETESMPMPPYFSGTGPPSRPSGAIFPSTSLGKTSPRSRSRAPGPISLSAKSFASLRMDCCSDVRSKSTRLLGGGALRGAPADRQQRVDPADVREATLEDVDPPPHVPDGLANVVAAVIGTPFERVLVQVFDATAQPRANVLEPLRHELGVAHGPSLWCGDGRRPPPPVARGRAHAHRSRDRSTRARHAFGAATWRARRRDVFARSRCRGRTP